MQKRSSFWKSFGELEIEVLYDSTSTMRIITLGLVHMRNLKKCINCNDLDIKKVTSHTIMQMFILADLKLEFEKTQGYSRWIGMILTILSKKTPKNATYLEATHILIHSQCLFVSFAPHLQK
jgi:hypothetical protein